MAVDDSGKYTYVYDGPLDRDFQMLLVLGLPASGKSTRVADPMSEIMNAFILDPDMIKKHLPEYVESHGAAADAVHFEGMALLQQAFDAFLTGDMNAHYKHVPEADRTRLEAGGGPVIDAPETIGDPISAALHTLYDTRLKCETPHVGPLFTFSGYRPQNSCLIDFVFATGNVRVLRHITCHERPDGVHPSDHDAVMARMMIR